MDFTKVKGNTIFKSIRYVLKYAKTDFFLMCLVKIFYSFIPILGVLINRKLFYIVQQNSNFNFSMNIIISIIVIYFVYLLISKWDIVVYERYFLTYNSLLNFEKKLRLLLHEKSTELNVEEFEREDIHQYTFQAQAASTNMLRITQIVVSLFSLLLSAFFLYSYFYKINTKLIILLILATFPSISEKIYESYLKNKNNTQIKFYERKSKSIKDCFFSLDSFCELKVNGGYSYLLKKWKYNYNELIDIKTVDYKKHKNIKLWCDFLKLIGNMGGFLVSIYIFYIYNDFSLFTATYLGFNVVSAHTNELFELMSYVSTFTVDVKPFFLFMDMDTKKNSYEDIAKFKYIELEKVTYKYRNGTIGVSDINLKILNGEKIAIVGKNGSGKTTLVKVLMGIYQPSSGKIAIDDINIENINFIDSSVMFQNYCKYPVSLYENITFDSIMDITSINRYLNQFRIKIDPTTFLGSSFGGVDLSEGEWQKIALIRLFYKSSQLIYFDEPSASIDPLQEDIIFDTIKEYCINKTAIVITHKLNLINFVDKIIVMDKGCIVGYGTHEELLNHNEFYRDMWEAQISNY